MFVFMSELDFRAEFAVYAGMAQTGYDLPDLYAGVPSVDPHTHPERVERWA
jgi:hypothetical protein